MRGSARRPGSLLSTSNSWVSYRTRWLLSVPLRIMPNIRSWGGQLSPSRRLNRVSRELISEPELVAVSASAGEA